jgi:hypothetical protein
MHRSLVTYLTQQTGLPEKRIIELYVAGMPWPVQSALARLHYDLVVLTREPSPHLMTFDRKLERLLSLQGAQLVQEFAALEQAFEDASLVQEHFPLYESAKRLRQHAMDVGYLIGEEPQRVLSLHRLMLLYYRTRFEAVFGE